ncbi:MAG: hypothetical protein FWF52_10930 [Candidatus Azobacteroides sp.]|nr:hypothetical protein [Candidatus Azobacteroides sp.]
MIFVVIVIFAIGLYIYGQKAWTWIIFFFFLTSGFNLIPEELTDIGIISKGSDFAFLILIGIIIIDVFCVKNYLKRDRFIMLLLLFGMVLGACIVWSKWIIGLTWSEIIRCCRYQFFWIAYLAFRNMEKGQLESLLKYLFNITVFISVLYLAQIIYQQTILNEVGITWANLFGIRIPRYYNQPDLIQFCTFMAVFNNPYRGMWRVATTTLLIMALLGAFHRSMQGFFLLSLLIGFILKLPHVRKIQFLSLLSIALLGGFLFAGSRLMNSRTFIDLQRISKGLYADVDVFALEDYFYESTFTFRLAVLYERNQYLWDNPKKLLLGAGLIPEDSPMANTFNFKVGLLDDITGRAVQIDCGDISYSSMIFRLGYLGTAMYLMLLIYLSVYFYKKHNHKYGLVTFLFGIMSFGVSFFSSNLLLPATYLLPLITYCIIQKTEQEEDSSDISCLTNI